MKGVAVYSERLIALFQGATHQGAPTRETHRGAAGVPGHGPYLILSLHVVEGVVREARFRTYGCPAAIACSEIVCIVSEGRELARLSSMTAADVALLVGGVPEGKEHCPELAARALERLALVTEADPPLPPDHGEKEDDTGTADQRPLAPGQQQ